MASCAVDVYLQNTTTSATLYSDDGVTPLSNPVTADANGVFTFYVADGIYDLRYVHSSITTTTEEDVNIFDPFSGQSGDTAVSIRTLATTVGFKVPTAAPAAAAAGNVWEASDVLKFGANSKSLANLSTEQSWSAQQTITAPATSGKRALILKGNATAATNVLDIYNSAASPALKSWFDSDGQFTTELNLAWKSGTSFTMTFDHALAANRTVTFPDAGAAASVAYCNTIGTSGTDLSWTAATGTLNVPDASASARGVITTGSQTIAGAKSLTGALSLASTFTVTSSNAAAVSVGRQGATDPAFKIDASAASSATGMEIVAAAAAGGVNLRAISSGAAENLTVNAKGTGTISLGSVSTGNITLARATGVTGALTVTSTGASALAVGANGATNPVLKIDASTGSVATGLSVTGAATGGTTAVAVTDSGSNASLTLDAKGTGTVTIAGTSSGDVAIVNAPLRYKQKTEVVTGTNTIAASETGTVFFLNSATEFDSVLPAPAAGLHFTFIVTAAPSGADYTISTNGSSNIIKGQVYTLDVNSGTDPDFETSGCDTISFVSAKSVAGDRVDLFCDGTNWFAHAFCSVFDAVTFTTAS